MPDWRIIDLNDTVRVKLTERGQQIWDRHWRPVIVITGTTAGIPQPDGYGWITYALWAVMSIFGCEARNGDVKLFTLQIDAGKE